MRRRICRWGTMNNGLTALIWMGYGILASEVRAILAQIEIYDQLWFVREGDFPKDENGMITGHSHIDKMDIIVKHCEKFSD